MFTGYDHIIPNDALMMIRSVIVSHNGGSITGFSFFNKEGKLIKKIGRTGTFWNEKTLLIEEHEVIIGVLATSDDGISF
jgi:hypothetical protein